MHWEKIETEKSLYSHYTYSPILSACNGIYIFQWRISQPTRAKLQIDIITSVFIDTA